MANHDSGPGPGPHSLARRPSHNAANTTVTLEVFDNEVFPPTLASISPILRVATEVEADRPRVAYLCRFYAFEKSVRLDPNSTGRVVRQFKTALHQRIERENISSLAFRVKRSDAREIESFYQQYYENYVRSLDKGQQGDRTQLAKAYQTAGVLFEVLCAVNKNGKNEEVAPEIIAAARNVQEMNEIYAPYNILPLDAAGASQPIMQFDEVKAAVSALRSTKGLTWPNGFEQSRQRTGDLDLLDWIRAMFGFQAGDEQVLELLLKTKINVNETDREGNSAVSSFLKSSSDVQNLGVKTGTRKYLESPGGCNGAAECLYELRDSELVWGEIQHHELKQEMQRAVCPSTDELKRKIFLGGLSPYKDSETLQNFDQFGTVENVVIITDQAGDQCSRGFGLIVCKNKQCVDAEVRHSVNLWGKKVEIIEAVFKHNSVSDIPRSTTRDQHFQGTVDSNEVHSAESRDKPMFWAGSLLHGRQRNQPHVKIDLTPKDQSVPTGTATFRKWFPEFLRDVTMRCEDGKWYPLCVLKTDFGANCCLEDHASIGYPKLSDFIGSCPDMCRMMKVVAGSGCATHIILLPADPTPTEQYKFCQLVEEPHAYSDSDTITATAFGNFSHAGSGEGTSSGSACNAGSGEGTSHPAPQLPLPGGSDPNFNANPQLRNHGGGEGEDGEGGQRNANPLPMAIRPGKFTFFTRTILAVAKFSESGVNGVVSAADSMGTNAVTGTSAGRIVKIHEIRHNSIYCMTSGNSKTTFSVRDAMRKTAKNLTSGTEEVARVGFSLMKQLDCLDDQILVFGRNGKGFELFCLHVNGFQRCKIAALAGSGVSHLEKNEVKFTNDMNQEMATREVLKIVQLGVERCRYCAGPIYACTFKGDEIFGPEILHEKHARDG